MVWASNPARADLAYLTTVPRYFNIQMNTNRKQKEVELTTSKIEWPPLPPPI